MRTVTALLLGLLLPLLGLAGIGQAQSSVQIQGNIEAVDCQGQTIVLSGVDGSNTIAAGAYTPVLINSMSVPFCALQQYVGAPATVWLIASGSQFVATRIDVAGEAAVVSPRPPVAPAPESAVAPAPLPIAGIVLGTIVVAGLLYLLVHDRDGLYCRYPYHGAYYRHYYRPEYRPYAGPYPPLTPVIAVPSPIAGVVLGTAIVAGLEYLVARDHDGRFSRYPYYGPYHRYYYGAAYRPYQGPYRDALVRQGDPRWDAPAGPDARNQPGPRDGVQNAPRTPPVSPNVLPQGQIWNTPTNQNDRRRDAPTHHDLGNHVPVPQNSPRLTPPAHPDASSRGNPGFHDPEGRTPARQRTPHGTPPDHQSPPASHNPNGNPPAYQNDRRHDAPRPIDPGSRAPAPRSTPRWAPPASQSAPADRGPTGNPRQDRNDRRRDAPGNRGAQCGGRAADQACSGDNGNAHR